MKVGRILGGAVVAFVIIAVAGAVLTARLPQAGPGSSPVGQTRRAHAARVACAAPAPARTPLVGVAPGPPWGHNLSEFIRATGVHPQIVAQYVSFGEPYNPAMACEAARAGAELLIQWDPMHVSLQRIADGAWDQYVTRFARAIRASQLPVVLSFGHEMNGNWYPWGYTRASPRAFVGAWQRLHDEVAAAGARNVTWCWDVNTWDPALAGQAANYGIGSPAPWWPGSKYVNWAGLDAYYDAPGDTFRSLFGSSLAALRKLTRKPVLIAETAAAAGPSQPGQIRTLFRGLKRYHAIGAIWFDGTGRRVWRLEGHPAAIAAFRAGVASLNS